MKKIMNEKIIAFALVAVLLLIGAVGLASAAAAVGSVASSGILLFSDNFDRTTLGAQWKYGAEEPYQNTVRIVDGRVQATDNGNHIELQQSFRDNFGIEVDIEKVGTRDYSCWDFYVELVALERGGVIRFDTNEIDGINIGGVPLHGKTHACGDEYSMDSAGPNKGTVTLEYNEPYIRFSFTNIDGKSLDTGRRWVGTFVDNSTKIRIWLAGYPDSPRYIDNVKVYSLGAPTPRPTTSPTISPTVPARPTLTPTPAPPITKYKKCVGDEPYLYVGDRVMGKGKTVEIPIIMCNAKDLANMDLDWSYDASVLKLIDVTKGSLTKKALFEWNEVSRGKLKIAFASSKGVSGSGSIAVMKFEVIGNTGAKSTITGTVDTASKTDGSTVSVGVNPGEVTVGTSPIKGDCDGDNKLTSRDALAALQISVQKRPFDICYDYNGDGKVNSADARDILKAIVTGGK